MGSPAGPVSRPDPPYVAMLAAHIDPAENPVLRARVPVTVAGQSLERIAMNLAENARAAEGSRWTHTIDAWAALARVINHEVRSVLRIPEGHVETGVGLLSPDQDIRAFVDPVAHSVVVRIPPPQAAEMPAALRARALVGAMAWAAEIDAAGTDDPARVSVFRDRLLTAYDAAVASRSPWTLR